MHKHKYHFFSRITNPDKVIEAKVKYFFDCLSIAFRFTNVHYDFPCENHKTIIRSIYYQIKYNKSKFVISHISFYLDMLGKDLNQYLIFDYNTSCLSNLKEYIRNLTEKEKPDFSKFELPLDELLKQLEETYFSKCLQKVINHIASTEELDSNPNNHSLIECVLFHTKLIAVDFYLTGASNKDINEIIDNICNKSLLKEDYQKRRHLQYVIEDLASYFENRTLIAQLKELELVYNLFKSKQTATFFIQPHYKISNEIDIDFFGVKITSTKPNNIEKNWYNEHFNKYDFGQAIINENTLFAIVEINSNHSNTINIARDKVQLAINSLSTISENEYVINFAYSLSKNTSSIPLKTEMEFDNNKFLNTIYQNFRNNKQILNFDIDRFLNEKDFIFITGLVAKKRTDLLINLWFYIEAFYLDSNKAISQTSQNLSKRIKEEFECSLYSFIDSNYFNYFMGMPTYITECDRKNFYTKYYAEVPVKLNFFKKRFKHPIITKKLIKAEKFNSSEQSKFEGFIKEYLKQVNINRNLFVHSLIENEYFTSANLNLLLVISNCFRQNLISKALVTPNELNN